MYMHTVLSVFLCSSNSKKSTELINFANGLEGGKKKQVFKLADHKKLF